jgi:hypothetical protein
MRTETTMKFEDVADELKRVGVDLHYSPSDGSLPVSKFT